MQKILMAANLARTLRHLPYNKNKCCFNQTILKTILFKTKKSGPQPTSTLQYCASLQC